METMCPLCSGELACGWWCNSCCASINTLNHLKFCRLIEDKNDIIFSVGCSGFVIGCLIVIIVKCVFF